MSYTVSSPHFFKFLIHKFHILIDWVEELDTIILVPIEQDTILRIYYFCGVLRWKDCSADLIC